MIYLTRRGGARAVPIYIVLMVPAGWVVKEWGPKHAVTADAVIQAVAFLLFPIVRGSSTPHTLSRPTAD